jgi:magnesium transporter
MTRFDLNTTLERVRSALGKEDVNEAIHILETLQQTQQIKLIDELDPADSADLLEELDPEDSADIIEALDPEDSAEIFEKLAPEDSAEILEEMALEDQADIIERLDPEDSAEIVAELDVEDQVKLLKTLDPEDSADILAELDTEEQSEITERVDDAMLSRILDEMEPDDAADVIGDLPEYRKERVLQGMTEADDVRPLLIHPDESAGGLMTTSFLTLRPGMRAQDAINAMREWHPDHEMPYYLFVVDAERKLVGIASLRQLVAAPPNKRIGEMMSTDVVSVPAGTDQEECARLLRKYGFLALPVVDAEHRLIGVITVDDLMNVAEDEVVEDAFRLSGVSDEESVHSNTFTSLKRRMPWLYINLLTAFAAATVVSLFESTIAQVAILAAMQSIVAGQGGNAATQRITIIVRGFATGEIDSNNALRILLKEIWLGVLQGLGIAVVVGLGVALWQRNYVLGGVVSLAMLGNLIVAGFSGAAIPMILHKLKIDPALASAVVVTTFTDCCGFGFSLGLATLMLRYI